MRFSHLFPWIGGLVSRQWPWFIAAWLAVLMLSRSLAPAWDDIAQDQEFGFLPADMPSRTGEKMFQKAFPDDRLASTIVVVVRDPAGNIERGRQFIADIVEPRLRHIAQAHGGIADDMKPTGDEPLFGDAPPTPAKPLDDVLVVRLRTPNAPGSGTLLVSEDGQVQLVVMELATEFLTGRNWSLIEDVEKLVTELQRDRQLLPPGVDMVVTGSAVIGRDYTRGQLESAWATERLTIILVVGLLLLIYRAPFLALIPLAMVYLGVKVSLSLLALMGQAGLITLFQGIQIYITILAYGAGVDYCLFLTARYRELLAEGRTPADAVAGAVGDVGAALTASAATVICGIGMMVFAQFGKFREAGFAIPFSIMVVLLATLTLMPALLRMAGRWAFWPGRTQATPPTGEARGVWRFLFRRGAMQRVWVGLAHLIQRHPGRLWLASVALAAPFAIAAALLHNRLSYDMVGNLPASAPSVTGTRLLQQHMPAGLMGPTNFLLIDPRLDFETPEGRKVVIELTRQLQLRREELRLADIRSLTAPLGITSVAQRDLDRLSVPAEVRQEAIDRAAREHYTTDLGERRRVGTRFELILAPSPFARQSIDDLERVERAVHEILAPHLESGARLYIAGATPSVRDLQAVMRTDRVRIELLVLASVLLILILLLRSFFTPLYLLASVLFSYYVTLGVTFAVFSLIDPRFTGIDWKVAIFLFTILIAVGEDYNIFLMARIDQETERHGPKKGITEALARTGPIISSCGLIMAGTFGALMSGSLAEMQQLGFALAFGVLLDTFVVRPILVPSFLLLLQRARCIAHRQRTGSTEPC